MSDDKKNERIGATSSHREDDMISDSDNSGSGISLSIPE